MTTEPPPIEESLGQELGRAMAAEPDPGGVPTPDWAPVEEGPADDDDPLPAAEVPEAAPEPEPDWDPVEPAA